MTDAWSLSSGAAACTVDRVPRTLRRVPIRANCRRQLLFPPPGEVDVRALLGEPPRGREPNPLAGSCNHGDLAVELTHY